MEPEKKSWELLIRSFQNYLEAYYVQYKYLQVFLRAELTDV